jgi:structural maintenance of chromosome 1
MKLDKLNENLKKLQHDKNRSNQVISTLTRELDRARSSQESHKVSTSQRLQTANQQDLKEYNETKEKLTIRTATDQQQLDHVKRQERSLLDKISQLNNKKEQVSTKIQTNTDLKTELNERIKQAEAEVKNYKTQISTTTKELTDKQNEQQRTLSRENELNEQLATILGQLVEAKIDSHQSDRQKKLMDALDTLKRSFTGVHGRLIDLVKPVHSKYHTSVSIVLGNNINSVVVDNESTAIECIKYMKEQRVGQAKFIPLSTIKTQPIQEKYRTIAKGARLAYEAIECDESIQQAVYYACGNTLITDSVNVAKEIVYQKEEEVKCVALDGTIIHRGGQITGGGADLSESEAKRKWQEKEILSKKFN